MLVYGLYTLPPQTYTCYLQCIIVHASLTSDEILYIRDHLFNLKGGGGMVFFVAKKFDKLSRQFSFRHQVTVVELSDLTLSSINPFKADKLSPSQVLILNIDLNILY